MINDCCIFKFLRRSVDHKHSIRFQSETSVFKFYRPSVDWPKQPFMNETTTGTLQSLFH